MLQSHAHCTFSRTPPYSCELEGPHPGSGREREVLAPPPGPMECLEQIIKVYLGSRMSRFKHSPRGHSDVIYRPGLMTLPPRWEVGTTPAAFFDFS